MTAATTPYNMADAVVSPTAQKMWRIDSSIAGGLVPLVLISPRLGGRIDFTNWTRPPRDGYMGGRPPANRETRD